MSRASLELTVLSHPQHQETVREWLAQLGAAFGLDEEQILHLKIAVSEACTNIFRHAYGQDPTRPIHFTATAIESGLDLCIRDFGSTFNPTQIPAPNLDEPHEGGYGVFLMRSLMDEVEYVTPPDGGTTLRLTKYRNSHRANH
jgi:anti-sigma regulatory factor (Ser/Thr protein kinase)